MSDPIVRIENLSRAYSKGVVPVAALKAVSVEINSGEYVAVMGPSGSGKSTLLNLLGLLDRPTEGHYFLGGQEVGTLDDDSRSRLRSRSIGFIFQSFNLFPQLDVAGNVEVPMIYAGIPAAERHRRAAELIDQVGLGPRRHHRPGELSGGEMQRVAIARSLVNDPLLLLADEPTGNLDTATAEVIAGILEDLHKKGRTIVMVTHNPELAKKTTRILRLRDGGLLPQETAA
ncbi:MAG TPA: ABC transporter ATP-binding protein [Planctomycetota bacterium]|nr:ABC transporter ATP-binding protein [Planctomycetota bacterium]